MNFNDLQELIPYAKGGKLKSLTMSPYDGVTLAMPGRHWKDTNPVGGDFVVMIDDGKIKDHQFKHDDIFLDVEKKAWKDSNAAAELMNSYLKIITGTDPLEFDGHHEAVMGTGINPYTFLRAVQCLAVAEHRRYAQFEHRVGGRYLPFRFAAGIVDGEWGANDCINMQKLGRPGVESLESTLGKPNLTKELFSCLKPN